MKDSMFLSSSSSRSSRSSSFSSFSRLQLPLEIPSSYSSMIMDSLFASVTEVSSGGLLVAFWIGRGCECSGDSSRLRILSFSLRISRSNSCFAGSEGRRNNRVKQVYQTRLFQPKITNQAIRWLPSWIESRLNIPFTVFMTWNQF